jgi:hypothetical protein
MARTYLHPLHNCQFLALSHSEQDIVTNGTRIALAVMSCNSEHFSESRN